MLGPQLIITAPVLLPLATLAFAVAVWRLRRTAAMSAPRLALAAVTCAYGAGVLNAVLLPFHLVVGGARDGMPPWRVFVHLVPLVDAFKDPIGIVLNVALFVPLGVILPLVLSRPTARRVVLTGFLVSLGIELVQLLTDVTVSSGRVADVDDLIGNTLGVVLGYVVFRLTVSVPAVTRYCLRTRRCQAA